MAVVFAFLLGGLLVEQSHFSKCEKVGFEGQVCAQARESCLLGGDEARCYPKEGEK